VAHWQVIEGSGGQRHTSGTPAGTRVGNFIFLSAIRGVDPETQEVIADPEAQARQAFENLRTALRAADAELSDVVKVGVYMTALQRDRPIFNTVWHSYFPDASPARFAVEVTDMGGKGDASLFVLDVTAAVGP
jgi:enamine deaminase RidA (YjgF/YER057c/UK114 family)